VPDYPWGRERPACLGGEPGADRGRVGAFTSVTGSGGPLMTGYEPAALFVDGSNGVFRRSIHSLPIEWDIEAIHRWLGAGRSTRAFCTLIVFDGSTEQGCEAFDDWLAHAPPTLPLRRWR